MANLQSKVVLVTGAAKRIGRDIAIRLAREGYYDGSAFFRVFPNGLIQGGDPLLKDPKTQRVLWGTGGLNMLAAELSDMKHERGVISTVSIPNRPDSDGAQFFVCVAPQPAMPPSAPLPEA